MYWSGSNEAAPRLTVTEHPGLSGLLHLETAWRTLYAQMPLPWCSDAFEGHLLHVTHLVDDPDSVRCLAVRDASDDRQVRAICLLQPVFDRSLGIPVPVWKILAPAHMPLGNVIAPEDDVRPAIIPAIVAYLAGDSQGKRLLHLGPLPTESTLWTGLADLEPSAWCLETSWSSHVIDCSRPFETYFSGLSKNFRANLRKARNKLEQLAGVGFVTATEGLELEAEFNAFLRIEASGWKGTAGTRTAILYRKGQPGFFRSLLSTCNNDTCCEVNALHVEGRTIAAQLCMRTGADFAVLKIAFDQEYARVAPGQLLLLHTLERVSADPRIRRVNLLGDAEWHHDWRPETIALQRAYLALDPIVGRSLIRLLRIRFGPARRVVRGLRRQRQALAARLLQAGAAAGRLGESQTAARDRFRARKDRNGHLP